MLTALIKKDLTEEARRKHEILALFSLVAALALPTAYLISGPGSVKPEDAPYLVVLGQQAVSLLVTSLLGFLLIIREAERGTIYALKLAPLLPETTVLVKIVVLFVFLLPLNFAFDLLVSFFASQAFITIYYLVYLLSLSLYMASLGALVSFMIIYTDVGTLLASVALAALSAPYLFSTAPQAVEALQGVPGIPFAFPPLGFLIISLMLGKFLVEL